MSGYEGEAATVRGWFLAEWDSGIPIHLIENSPFPDKPDNAPWARLSIRNNPAGPATVGGPSRRYRHGGSIILEVFVPADIGDGLARELADAGATIIREKQEDGITVWSVQAIPIGVEDGWYRINVLGTFSRDEVFTVT